MTNVAAQLIFLKNLTLTKLSVTHIENSVNAAGIKIEPSIVNRIQYRALK